MALSNSYKFNQIVLSALTFSALVAIVSSASAFAVEPEEVSVTASKLNLNGDQQQVIQNAKRQIAFAQLDSGYYYSGAAGARNRINDIRAQRQLIEQAQDSGRLPASVSGK